MPILGLTLVSLVSARAGLQHSHPKRDLSVSGSFSGWSYAGCYTDTPASRGLSLAGYNDDAMTEAKCIQYCDQKGYSHAATEYSRECYCGYDIQSPSTLAADSDCNYACGGDANQACGGSGYMTVFTNGQSAPAENPGPDGWQSLGCYTDSVSSRTLSNFYPPSDGITFVYSCTTICSQNGFKYAGVEYGRECYCGNDILAPGAPASSGCDMACTGNSHELCGGANRMNLYQAV